MPSYNPPKKNTAYVTYISLTSQANTKLFQSNPTIAAGDVTVSTDGAALANLATLPVVTPAGSRRVKVSLSAAEMNGDTVSIMCNDVAGAEWCDLHLVLQTTSKQFEDIPTAAAIATAVWDTLTSALTTAGSIGKRIADNLDALITSRMATFTYTAPDNSSITAIKAKTDNLPANTSTTLSTLQTGVDDIPTNAELAISQAGADDATIAAIAALNNLSAAQVNTEADTALADVGLTTTITGRIDDAISSRNAIAPDNATISAIAAYLAGLSIPSASDIATAVWAAGTRSLTTFGTLIADIWAAATRTLTSSAGGATAAEVWSYVTRTITGGGGSAADIWGYATRTLTQTAAQVQGTMTGSDLNIVRAVTFSAMLTGLNFPSGWTKVYFTIKTNLGVPDSMAALQIVLSNPGDSGDGIVVVNHAPATEMAAQGSLVADDVAGSLAIRIEDDATEMLTQSNPTYDVKVLVGGDSTSVLLAAGRVSINHTDTESIT